MERAGNISSLMYIERYGADSVGVVGLRVRRASMVRGPLGSC